MKSKTYSEWYKFGWKGITFDVPKDWNLGSVTSDPNRKKDSGYLRLDDSQIARVEVEWRPSHEGISISRLVSRYLENLEKKANKVRATFKVNRKVGLVKFKDVDFDYECFIWEADYRAYNLAIKCKACGRVVVLRVLSRLDDNVEKVAAKILYSLEDHSKGGRNFWGIYDLACWVPDDLMLEEYSLKSGHIQLEFQREKNSFSIDCISLANILLKGISTIEWHSDFFKKKLRDLNCSYKEIQFQGHPGIEILGVPKNRWKRLFKPLPWVERKPRLFLKGKTWYCEDSNKIFVVHNFTRNEEDSKVEVIEIGCHKKEEAHQPRGDAVVKTDQERPAGVGKGLPG